MLIQFEQTRPKILPELKFSNLRLNTESHRRFGHLIVQLLYKGFTCLRITMYRTSKFWRWCHCHGRPSFLPRILIAQTDLSLDPFHGEIIWLYRQTLPLALFQNCGGSYMRSNSPGPESNSAKMHSFDRQLLNCCGLKESKGQET